MTDPPLFDRAAKRLQEAGLHCRMRNRQPVGGSVTEIVGGTEYETVNIKGTKVGIFTGQLFCVFEHDGEVVCQFDLHQRGGRSEHRGSLDEVVDWLIEKAQ